jgi:hypothetical protein
MPSTPEGAFIDRAFIELKSGESISLRDYETNFYRRMTNSAASSDSTNTVPASGLLDRLSTIPPSLRINYYWGNLTDPGPSHEWVWYKKCQLPKKFVDAALETLKKRRAMCKEKKDDKTLVWQEAMEIVEGQAIHIAKEMEAQFIRCQCQVEDYISVIFPPDPYSKYLEEENLGAWYIYLRTHPHSDWLGHASMLATTSVREKVFGMTYYKEVRKFLDDMGLRIQTKHWYDPIMDSTATFLASIPKNRGKIDALYHYGYELARQREESYALE